MPQLSVPLAIPAASVAHSSATALRIAFSSASATHETSSVRLLRLSNAVPTPQIPRTPHSRSSNVYTRCPLPEIHTIARPLTVNQLSTH
ncbi:hypothetical protein P154DRAFT_523351, partial [Amniculicola lignicola CBS 123094]